MDFLLQMVFGTAVSGFVAYHCLRHSEKNILIGFCGAFLAIGAIGGVVVVGFMVSVLVYAYVARYTFELLGYIIAAPFVIGPVWFMFKMLSGSKREYDGRGFGDGSGGA